MERPLKGNIVVIRFPFSDFSSFKRRPALVLAAPKGNDSILCQITSKRTRDSYAIPIGNDAFEEGSLKKPSNIRPNKLFTAENSTILYKAGKLEKQKLTQAVGTACSILQG